MNSAYKRTYETNEYSDIGEALYDRMGKEGDYFSLADLYADMDAINLFILFDSTFPVAPNNYKELSIESSLNSYYQKGSNVSEHMKEFVINDDITSSRISKYIKPHFEANLATHFLKYDFSSDDEQKCTSAFIRYLNDNFGVNIAI